MSEITTNYNFQLPGANAGSKRLADIQAVKAAIIAIDARFQINKDKNLTTTELDNILGATNGIATLDSNGKVPSNQLPSYVDDVIDSANFASLPALGEAGKIYILANTGEVYRWSGSVYVNVTSAGVNSVNNKTGIVIINKDDVGLSNVDNTRDIDKPISSATLSMVTSIAASAQLNAISASTPVDHIGSVGATHGAVTNLVNGFMTSVDKVKLDTLTKNIPQNIKSVDYILTSIDAGGHILHPAIDSSLRTYTIPANATVPYEIGTAITFINQNGAGNVNIAITADVMRLAGNGSVGTRALSANGVATAIKITATEWIISGTNLT